MFPPLLRQLKFIPEILKFSVSINGEGGFVYYGVLDTLGKWVIKPETAEERNIIIPEAIKANEVVNGLLPNNRIVFYYKKYFKDLKESKFGAVDHTGKTIIPFKYDDYIKLKDGYGRLEININENGIKNHKEVLVDPFGRILTDLDYSTIHFAKKLFENNENTKKKPQPMLLFAVVKNGLYGFINEKGALIIPPKLLTYGDINENEGTIVA